VTAFTPKCRRKERKVIFSRYLEQFNLLLEKNFSTHRRLSFMQTHCIFTQNYLESLIQQALWPFGKEAINLHILTEAKSAASSSLL